jgi:predicted DNA-binding transcriptional regulator AlpA
MEYLRDKQAAHYLGIGVSTLWLFSKQKKLRAIKLSERVTVWSKSELEAFVQSKIISA